MAQHAQGSRAAKAMRAGLGGGQWADGEPAKLGQGLHPTGTWKPLKAVEQLGQGGPGGRLLGLISSSEDTELLPRSPTKEPDFGFLSVKGLW